MSGVMSGGSNSFMMKPRILEVSAPMSARIPAHSERVLEPTSISSERLPGIVDAGKGLCMALAAGISMMILDTHAEF